MSAKTKELDVVYPPVKVETPYEHYVAADEEGKKYSVSGKYHAKLVRIRKVNHPSQKSFPIQDVDALLKDGGLSIEPKLHVVLSPDESTAKITPNVDINEHQNVHEDYQQVLLEIRADSAIDDVDLHFIFPDSNNYVGEKPGTATKLGTYPDGFAELYNTKLGALPDVPKTVIAQYSDAIFVNDGLFIEIGRDESQIGNEAIDPDNEEKIQVDEVKPRREVCAVVHDKIMANTPMPGVKSMHDSIFTSIVQLPVGPWGLDVRVKSEHTTQIQRYWFDETSSPTYPSLYSRPLQSTVDVDSDIHVKIKYVKDFEFEVRKKTLFTKDFDINVRAKPFIKDFDVDVHAKMPFIKDFDVNVLSTAPFSKSFEVNVPYSCWMYANVISAVESHGIVFGSDRVYFEDPLIENDIAVPLNLMGTSVFGAWDVILVYGVMRPPEYIGTYIVNSVNDLSMIREYTFTVEVTDSYSCRVELGKYPLSMVRCLRINDVNGYQNRVDIRLGLAIIPGDSPWHK
jgi:hypothetical protein